MKTIGDLRQGICVSTGEVRVKDLVVPAFQGTLLVCVGGHILGVCVVVPIIALSNNWVPTNSVSQSLVFSRDIVIYKEQLNKEMAHILVLGLGSSILQWAGSWKVSQSRRELQR